MGGSLPAPLTVGGGDPLLVSGGILCTTAAPWPLPTVFQEHLLSLILPTRNASGGTMYGVGGKSETGAGLEGSGQPHPDGLRVTRGMSWAEGETC